MSDFTVYNEGTIFLLQPLTEAARHWADECLPEDAQRLGSAYVVEHRFIWDFVGGITTDGLGVN